MGKTIDIDVRVNSGQAKQGFDGLNVSAKDLHDRIRDLDIQAQKLKETYGQTYRQAPQFARIDRERGIALEQLVSLQDKEVEATKRSVRGLGSLASATIAATGSVSGLGTGISVLTNALYSGVGLTAGLAAAVAGFSALMGIVRATAEETKKMKDEISNLLEIEGPGGKFKIAPEKLPAAIEKLKSDIEYNFKKTSEGTQRGEFMEKGTESTWKAMLGVLEEANDKYQQQLQYIEALKNAGFLYTEEVKTQTEELEKQAKIYRAGEAGSFGARKLGFDSFGFAGKDSGGKNKAGMTAEYTEMQRLFKEREQLANEFSQRTSSVFTNNMIQAWQIIFGEANSLFEQLMAQWSAMLLEKVGSGIFSFLFGGFDIFGMARGILGGQATAAKYGMGR